MSMIFADGGTNPGKMMNGFKRLVIFDTLGLVWSAFVQVGGLSDTVNGSGRFGEVKERFVCMQKILAVSA